MKELFWNFVVRRHIYVQSLLSVYKKLQIKTI